MIQYRLRDRLGGHGGHGLDLGGGNNNKKKKKSPSHRMGTPTGVPTIKSPKDICLSYFYVTCTSLLSHLKVTFSWNPF